MDRYVKHIHAYTWMNIYMYLYLYICIYIYIYICIYDIYICIYNIYMHINIYPSICMYIFYLSIHYLPVYLSIYLFILTDCPYLSKCHRPPRPRSRGNHGQNTFQHPLLTSKPATMKQSAQTTVPPNHHKAMGLSCVMFMYLS